MYFHGHTSLHLLSQFTLINMTCLVCLTPSHFISLVCSFLCLSMPRDCSPTTHSLCLTYVDVEPSSYSICFMCACVCHLSLCSVIQTWVKMYLQVVSDELGSFIWRPLPYKGKHFNSTSELKVLYQNS